MGCVLKDNFELIEIEGRQCYVFLPKDYNNDEKSYPVVYINGDKSIHALLKEADFLSEISYIIVIVISENRLNELTPWPSYSLHPKFPDFGGNGDEYINFIETRLKPKVDLNYRTLPLPESTGIAGYSLGGLITIYAFYNATCFGCFASMSGSFWYPEFVSYATNKSSSNHEAKIYISSGDSEGVGHKDIKKDAVAYTKEIYNKLASDLTTDKVTIYWDEGGHHDNTYQRYKNALLWLNNNLKSN